MLGAFGGNEFEVNIPRFDLGRKEVICLYNEIFFQDTFRAAFD